MEQLSGITVKGVTLERVERVDLWNSRTVENLNSGTVER